ncbi:hypothetical protein [Flavobacterium sp. W20_MBD1_R3]|uniref:hypothetical protein n=1 Tax=Flavobacterium sp. W20_MBD1_R3 TaxID=3240278 RepID=UPI003F8ED00B
MKKLREMIIKDEYLEGMTYPELINKIKMQGRNLENAILELQNDKYAEIAMISYKNNFYAGWVVLDTFIEKVYDEYFEVFDTHYEAFEYYNNLGDKLNGKRYE